MKRQDLIDLIEEGENIHCEFKQKFSSAKKIAKEMIAFANTAGGFILFGIADDKEVVGVESEKTEAELIADAANNFCEPPVEYYIHYKPLYGKEIVIVEIPESEFKPHRVQDYLTEFDINKAVVTIRVNDKAVQASKEMIRILRAQYGGLTLKNYKIGPNEQKVFNYLKKSETISVKELSDLANISHRRASRTLTNLVRANLLAIHVKDNGEEFFTALG